jgi:hypothetical protein
MQGGGVQGHGTHGDSRALPHREAGSETAGCATTPKHSRIERLGLVLRVTWQCVVARPASHRSLELVRGGIWSARY